MKEIKIGDQIWASSNLTTTTFNNGEAIPVLDPKSFKHGFSELQRSIHSLKDFATVSVEPSCISRRSRFFVVHSSAPIFIVSIIKR